MGVKICTSEYMLATRDGVDFSRSWFPRIVAEAFLESTKDGEISRAPDPVVMIKGGLSWLNNTGAPQMVFAQIGRAPRSIVAQSPATVVIHDAWTWAVGEDPAADYPSVAQNTVGGRCQVDRQETAARDLTFARFFLDADASVAWETIGVVQPGDSVHLRYEASVQTPGDWTTPTEFDGRWDAQARWARLILFATPVGAS